MASASNKRIEESATTALKDTLLRCRYIDSFIDSNDKTPSWDGSIFVYNSVDQKKSSLLGRVPIQVKGTQKCMNSEQASFSCEVVDLKNYYNDGGCVFFVVRVDPASGVYKIFYTSLLAFDLAKILRSTRNHQNKYRIKLKSFPKNEKEIANVFMTFLQNKPKQMNLIGKNILSIEELEKKGTIIESLSFGATGVGLNNEGIEQFITTNEFYLYARPKGVDIDIPVEKISNVIMTRVIDGAVATGGTTHYSSYQVVYKKGKPSFKIGQGMLLTISDEAGKSNISFNPAGTLSDFIKDATFFLAVAVNKEITINGINLSLGNFAFPDIEERKVSLQYFKDVKKMLDMLGVTEELQCESLSKKDQKNLHNLVGAVLYGKRIGFGQIDSTVVFGPLIIANLTILIWATKEEDGHYTVESFFNDHEVFLFADENITHQSPILGSHYMLMKQEAFEHSSNMDYDKIYESLAATIYSPQIMDQAIMLMLEMLKGYDAQSIKDPALIELASKVCKWIEKNDPQIDSDIALLNKLQIAKRQRQLDIDEIILLGELIKTEKPASIRCGAYLLLGDNAQAQSCFDKMPSDIQREFLAYPICSFGKLN